MARRWSLTPGGEWQRELGAGLDASVTCAVFVGPHDLGAWELQELAVAFDRAARQRSFRVFAVLLPGVEEPFDPNRLPHFLRTRMWVDFRGGRDDARALQDLFNAIKGVPFGPNAPLAVPAVRSRRIAACECSARRTRGSSSVANARSSGCWRSSRAAGSWLCWGRRQREVLAGARRAGAASCAPARWPTSRTGERAGAAPGRSAADRARRAARQAAARAGDAGDARAGSTQDPRSAAPRRRAGARRPPAGRARARDRRAARGGVHAVSRRARAPPAVRDAAVRGLRSGRADRRGRDDARGLLRALRGRIPSWRSSSAAQQMLVGPMDADGLRQAIEEPARRVGLELERGCRTRSSPTSAPSRARCRCSSMRCSSSGSAAAATMLTLEGYRGPAACTARWRSAPRRSSAS